MLFSFLTQNPANMKKQFTWSDHCPLGSRPILWSVVAGGHVIINDIDYDLARETLHYVRLHNTGPCFLITSGATNDLFEPYPYAYNLSLDSDEWLIRFADEVIVNKGRLS